jgi:putative heme-binding domain-containing protein
MAAIFILSLAAVICRPMCAEESHLAPLVRLLGESDDIPLQRDVLAGMREGLRGRRNVPMPENWPAVYARLAKSDDNQVREDALAMALTFGDPQAVAALQKTILNRSAPAEQRQRALSALAESRAAELAPLLHGLLDDPAIRSAAIRALAAYPDPQTPRLLLDRYAQLNGDDRQDVIQTLASRTDFALGLLDAVGKKRVEAAEISAVTARQLLALGSEAVSKRLKEVWGEVRSTGAEKQKQIARYKGLLTPEFLEDADVAHGRLVYSRTCQKCHRLYGEGGEIGPDLTGSNRANLDYILENAFDPSAIIPREWRMNTVITADGRVLTGILIEDAPESIVLQTVNERLSLSREDIDEIAQTPISMMPEGQFDMLTPQEVRDLVGYLRTTAQVPLPENVKINDQPGGASPRFENQESAKQRTGR